MLRYKTKTRPGVVALCYIRPGNGAGLFLQPRSLHGVLGGTNHKPGDLALGCHYFLLGSWLPSQSQKVSLPNAN